MSWEDNKKLSNMVAAKPPIARPVSDVIDMVFDIPLLALETGTTKIIDIIYTHRNVYIYKYSVDLKTVKMLYIYIKKDYCSISFYL